MTNPIDTAELRRLASEATPGPYTHRSERFDEFGMVRGGPEGDGLRMPFASCRHEAHLGERSDPNRGVQCDRNGLFVAAACNQAIPLCDALDAAEARADVVEARLDDLLAKYYSELAELRAQVPRWIPVSERLPESEGQFLAMLDGKTTTGRFVSIRAGTAKAWFINGTPIEPTHWQPLPEPPKENQ